MTRYIDRDGNEITKEQISAAFKCGKARIVYGYNSQGTFVEDIMLDGVDFDTRGECYQMCGESWTKIPSRVEICYEIARCNAGSEQPPENEDSLTQQQEEER